MEDNILQEISNETQNQEIKDIISVLNNLDGSVEEMVDLLQEKEIVDFGKHDNKISKN